MKFTIKTQINAPLKTVFNAWLNSESHSKMTGGEAVISDQINGSFTAWDGYIWGKNLEIDRIKRILQSWRTSEFSEDEGDSLLEILFSEVNGATEITLTHSNLPPNGEQYKQGWEDHYFSPMKVYFQH
jgi:activator of HSP90 ATPase